MKTKIKISVIIIGIAVAAYCAFTTIMNSPGFRNGVIPTALNTESTSGSMHVLLNPIKNKF